MPDTYIINKATNVNKPDTDVWTVLFHSQNDGDGGHLRHYDAGSYKYRKEWTETNVTWALQKEKLHQAAHWNYIRKYMDSMHSVWMWECVNVCVCVKRSWAYKLGTTGGL